ncbi:hypothetical protein KIN20_025698 [Parelaphostrongylus tenuis]|uniref:Uncharacterized protein n=1 Tax=Parelaphostrongylus tenuis TaxID=148309 RepID=A0AAD5MYR9_PARTN|nr:hypothetical protein KIN20_025698 [Parelaphostrongylus tenuis]
MCEKALTQYEVNRTLEKTVHRQRIHSFACSNAIRCKLLTNFSVSGIASERAAAQGFEQRLIMQTVCEVLERQCRSALLPDPVITSIRVNLKSDSLMNQWDARKLLKIQQMNDASKQYLTCQVLSTGLKVWKVIALELL